jgi:hypothetical protein
MNLYVLYCIVLYSLYSREHGSAAIAAIFRVMLILQAHESTNVVSCVNITP